MQLYSWMLAGCGRRLPHSIFHQIRSIIAPNICRCSRRAKHSQGKTVELMGESYLTDSWTNVTPRVLTKIGRGLHNRRYHPINLIRLRIQNFFYANYQNRAGNPIYAVFDNINPIVTTNQNFDSLLIAEDHPSRSPSDTYYINCDRLLRPHTSAHQAELVSMGFNAFLVVGDVYRRDEIDASHYPVFHQMEGVRLFSEKEVFRRATDPTGLTIFETQNCKRTSEKQECHTYDAARLVEYDLKEALTGLAQRLFGKNIEYQWVECYFPFTHPSWELEIKYQGKWLEVLGCGIMEQEILNKAGAESQIGWAFGLGLDRLAMKLYDIPDIRLFWSQDPGFLGQFQVDDPESPLTYKPVSQYPPCINDISFWVPPVYNSNDFFDLVGNIGGDFIEQVTLVDEFTHPKYDRRSHCYRIVYRHMEKIFTQDEVNIMHEQIADLASRQLGVEVRSK